MKNSKLASLLVKLEGLSDDKSATQNDFAAETINELVSRNLKGGSNPTANTTCNRSTNSTCNNSTCNESTNGVCNNGTCDGASG